MENRMRSILLTVILLGVVGASVGRASIVPPCSAGAAGEKIIVDRVLRYENLMDDLAEVFSKLKVHFEGSLGIRAKSEYRTDHTAYQLVFNDEQRKIVEKAFAKEIELHGYRFSQSKAPP